MRLKLLQQQTSRVTATAIDGSTTANGTTTANGIPVADIDLGGTILKCRPEYQRVEVEKISRANSADF